MSGDVKREALSALERARDLVGEASDILYAAAKSLAREEPTIAGRIYGFVLVLSCLGGELSDAHMDLDLGIRELLEEEGKDG